MSSGFSRRQRLHQLSMRRSAWFHRPNPNPRPQTTRRSEGMCGARPNSVYRRDRTAVGQCSAPSLPGFMAPIGPGNLRESLVTAQGRSGRTPLFAAWINENLLCVSYLANSGNSSCSPLPPSLWQDVLRRLKSSANHSGNTRSLSVSTPSTPTTARSRSAISITFKVRVLKARRVAVLLGG